MEKFIAVTSVDNKYYMLIENNYEVKAHILDKNKIKDEFYVAFNDIAPANIKILRNVDTDIVNFMKKVYLDSICETYEQAVKRRAKSKLLGMKLKDDTEFSQFMFRKLRLNMYKCRDNFDREVIFLYKQPFHSLEVMKEINTRTLEKMRKCNSIDELNDLWLLYTPTLRDIWGKEVHELFTKIIDCYKDFDVDEIIVMIQNSPLHVVMIGVKDGKLIEGKSVWLSEDMVIEHIYFQTDNVKALKKAYTSESYSMFSIRGKSIKWVKE